MLKSVRSSFFFRHYCDVTLSVTNYTNNKIVEIDRSLLITHGLLGSKQNWNSIAKRLNNKFREVVTLDLRNHGESPHSDDVSIEVMAGDIHRHILSNNYKHPILLGHSLGGKVAMFLALSQPKLLSSLVVVDVAPVTTYQIDDYKAFIEAMISADIDQAKSLSDNRKNVDQYLTKSIENADIRSFLLTNLVRDESTNDIRWRANLHALRNGLSELTLFPVPAGGVYSGPTLFVTGARSDYVRNEHWPRIKELFPSVRLEVVAGAGHWVHADKPHDFVSILEAFAVGLMKK